MVKTHMSDEFQPEIKEMLLGTLTGLTIIFFMFALIIKIFGNFGIQYADVCNTETMKSTTFTFGINTIHGISYKNDKIVKAEIKNKECSIVLENGNKGTVDFSDLQKMSTLNKNGQLY